MTHEKAQTLFADLQSGLLHSSKKNEVEQHLSECGSCRTLYDVFTLALNVDTPRHRLAADPFLPTRIRAIAADRAPSHPSVKTALRWSVASVAFSVAVALGILLGEGISHPRQTVGTVGDEMLVSEFASTLSQYTVTDQWNSAVQPSSSQGDAK
jgi:predicted anti-sigma-YlaC factor YlaD